MKKFIIATLMFMAAAATASAQKLMIGEKAPELKIHSWLNQKPAQGMPRLIEFFHTTNKASMERLAVLDSYKEKFGGKLSVVLISSESADVVRKAALTSPRNFSVGIDDNSQTLNNYTQYIPFTVLTDAKGKVVWFGNPRNLKDETIRNTLK